MAENLDFTEIDLEAYDDQEVVEEVKNSAIRSSSTLTAPAAIKKPQSAFTLFVQQIKDTVKEQLKT